MSGMSMFMKRLVALFFLGAVLLPLLSGCAHAQARTAAEMPPLDVPAPPPRVVEPTSADVTVPLGPVGPLNEPAQNAPPRPARAAGPSNAPAPPRPDSPRSDAPRTDAPAPGDSPKAADDPAKLAAPQTLQTTSAQQEGEVAARIRAVLSQAGSNLNRIDYTKLSANLKSQYDQAKRFVSQSEDALQAKNLPFAETLADKAAELADQLAGR
jgi:hypothetical protein